METHDSFNPQEVEQTAVRSLALSIMAYWTAGWQLDSTPPLNLTLPQREGPFQAAVIETVARLGGRLAIEPLVELLDADHNLIRSYAVWELGQVGDERVLPLLEAVRRLDRGRSEFSPHLKTIGEEADQAIRWIEKQIRFDRLRGLTRPRPEPLPNLKQIIRRIERRASFYQEGAFSAGTVRLDDHMPKGWREDLTRAIEHQINHYRNF